MKAKLVSKILSDKTITSKINKLLAEIQSTNSIPI
jgi:hypothetical protein